MSWEALGEAVAIFLLKAMISTFMLLAVLFPFVLLAVLLQWISYLLRKRWLLLLGERSWIALAAPGTIIHETGHAIFCLIFRHRIVEMKLFSPAPDGTLGYVNHSWDPKSTYQSIGNFFIGLGPIISGSAVIIFATALLLPEVWAKVHTPDYYTMGDLIAGTFGVSWQMFKSLGEPELLCRYQSWIWLIITLLIGSHITLSRPDLKGVKTGAVTLLVMIVILNLAISWWHDPAALLLKYAGCQLALIAGLLLFVLLILGTFTLLIYLPVFTPSGRR